MKKVKVSYTLSKAIVDELDFFAEELDEKKSHLIEKALDFYFACVGEKIAIKEAEKVENGEAELFSFEDVIKEIEEKEKVGVE